MRFNGDDDDEELDAEFLRRWGGNTVTLDDDEESSENVEDLDDEEENDPWANADRQRKSSENEEARQLATLLRAEEEKLRLKIEARRAVRRDYQRRYRAGEIAPVRAAEFRRDKTLDEPRQRITYKLTIEMDAAFRAYLAAHKTERRKVLALALESYIASTPIPASPIASSSKRRFMYDEIPASLWARADAYCRLPNSKRALHHYQLIEMALDHFLKVLPNTVQPSTKRTGKRASERASL